MGHLHLYMHQVLSYHLRHLFLQYSPEEKQEYPTDEGTHQSGNAASEPRGFSGSSGSVGENLEGWGRSQFHAGIQMLFQTSASQLKCSDPARGISRAPRGGRSAREHGALQPHQARTNVTAYTALLTGAGSMGSLRSSLDRQ